MPEAPAFCDSCGSIFGSGFHFEESTNIILSGCTSICPYCGGIGRIPDGVYNFVGSTIELLTGPQRSVTELQLLARILKEAKEKKSSFDEVSTALKKEVPELSSISDILPRSRTELYAFITIILSIIGLVIAARSKNETPQIEVQQVINNVVNQSNVKGGKVRQRPPANKRNKIGRNEPCPCGSRRKYKKCCGA